MTDPELLIIDLSEHRAGLTRGEFTRLHRGGCRGLGVRVSVAYADQGIMHADTTAAGYVAKARRHGWVVFGYAYLNPRDGLPAKDDAYEQGEFYARTAEPLDLDGHFLDVEKGTIRRQHNEYATLAMRQGLRSQRVSGVGVYSREDILTRFASQRRLWDSEWLAHYGPIGEPAARTLADWQTPLSREPYRAGPLWQYGPLEYTRPNGRPRRVDGNVWQGTQHSLMEYMR
jgi:hypothetical protein